VAILKDGFVSGGPGAEPVPLSVTFVELLTPWGLELDQEHPQAIPFLRAFNEPGGFDQDQAYFLRDCDPRGLGELSPVELSAIGLLRWAVRSHRLDRESSRLVALHISAALLPLVREALEKLLDAANPSARAWTLSLAAEAPTSSQLASPLVRELRPFAKLLETRDWYVPLWALQNLPCLRTRDDLTRDSELLAQQAQKLGEAVENAFDSLREDQPPVAPLTDDVCPQLDAIAAQLTAPASGPRETLVTVRVGEREFCQRFLDRPNLEADLQAALAFVANGHEWHAPAPRLEPADEPDPTAAFTDRVSGKLEDEDAVLRFSLPGFASTWFIPAGPDGPATVQEALRVIAERGEIYLQSLVWDAMTSEQRDAQQARKLGAAVEKTFAGLREDLPPFVEGAALRKLVAEMLGSLPEHWWIEQVLGKHEGTCYMRVCAGPPGGSGSNLLHATHDYPSTRQALRAVAVWLASRGRPGLQRDRAPGPPCLCVD